jgi:hypothetical protein
VYCLLFVSVIVIAPAVTAVCHVANLIVFSLLFALNSHSKIWMECPAPVTQSDEEKNAKQLYEEAAFAAMLETIKRKDEATHTGQQAE